MNSRDEPVVVVGSGPLGAVAARRLAEAGRAVIIFEAGPAIRIHRAPTSETRPDTSGTGLVLRRNRLAHNYFDQTAPPRGCQGRR